MEAVKLVGSPVLKRLTEDLCRRSKLKSMPLRGLLKNIRENNLPYDVFVDKWPQYTTVVARPNSMDIPVYRLGLYSEDTVTLQNIMCSENFLPQCKVIRTMAVPMEHLETFENVANKLNFNATFIGRDDPRNFIVLNLTGRDDYVNNVASLLPNDLYYAPLDTKHMDRIVSDWKTFNWNEFYAGDTEGIAATKYYITKCGPSLGVYKKSNNELISWLLSDIDTSGLMDYTLPAYRKTVVTNCRKIEWARQKLLIGEYYWGSIAKSNTLSWKSFARYGESVTTHPEVDLFHCIFRPNNNKRLLGTAKL